MIPPRLRTELPRIIRFLIVGVMTVIIAFALYALLSRRLFPNGNRTLEQAAATIVSSIFNYLAHRRITYRSRGSHRTQTFRYLMVWISANLLQAFLFWLGHEAWRFYDYAVLFVVTGLIACYTYVIHRMYTFRDILSRVASSRVVE